uniref:Uncharacterized protein n=1 Tax=Arundo donax TaxID=35708 RepID=A0A0A8YIG6_ARUDO
MGNGDDTRENRGLENTPLGIPGSGGDTAIGVAR